MRGGLARTLLLRAGRIAQQVEHRGAERVLPALDLRRRLIQVYAELFILVSMLLDVGQVAGGKRQPVAIVNGPLRDLPRDSQKPRVVLIPPYAVRLHGQAAANECLVRARD